MLTQFFSRRLAVVVMCILALSHMTVTMAFALDGSSPAGTVISNRAAATYQDDSGTIYDAVSPTVSVTVLAISTLVVTPDETESSATVGQRDRITRAFRVCNTGNVATSYTITRGLVNAPASLVNLYFDNDNDGSVSGADTLIVLNDTSSSNVNPGGCLGVLAVVDVNDSPVNSALTIQLTARSNAGQTANGNSEDNGTIINTVGAGTHLTGPDGTGDPVKTVNGASQISISQGDTFTYTIAFRNGGDVAARAVVVADDLSSSMDYVAGSLTLDNRSLTDEMDADEGSVQDRQVRVQLPTVAPAQVVRITFRARLNGAVTGGVGIPNSASFTGQNVPAVTSTTAIVVVDPFGTVFAARGGAAAPIPGAQVEILADQIGNPLAIPAGVGFSPNLQNDNPFRSDNNGHFSFALSPEQLGTQSSPSQYFVKATAAGYSTRMLVITLHPTLANLFGLTIHALDGQPLAIAGGFELVRNDVSIADMADIALNIPMFEVHGLEITKSADRQRVEVGDALAYRVDIHNPTAAPVTNVSVSDRLPVSFNYVSGTGRLEIGSAPESPIEPQTVNGEIIFQIGEIPAGATAHVRYRVRIGVNAQQGDQDNLAIASGTFPNGERDQTAPAKATVSVGSGVFSTRQVVVGRVFDDVNGNGKFDYADKPMPGVRLFLANGESVVTDSAGMYNFPSLGDGAQVISLDPITLPPGYALADGNSLSGKSWARLLRTPIGGGALLRQNFALVRNGRTSTTAGIAGPVLARPVSVNESSATTNPQTASRDQVTQTSGTYEVAATESLDPIAPGEIKILSPAPNAVIMSPALQVDVRVAMNWTARLEVNGKAISYKSIGTTRVDHKNSVATFSFVGIDLRPGPNGIRATAVGPDGKSGRSVELSCMGRGPAKRLEIVNEKNEIHADGGDATTLHVRAFDRWGSPALDEQIALEASAGELLPIDRIRSADSRSAAPSATTQLLKSASGTPAVNQQVQRNNLSLPMIDGEAAVKLIATGAPGEARIHAQLGQLEAETKVRITPASRPTILVGLAEMSVGQSVPEINLRGETGNHRNRLSFFLSSRLPLNSMLTLAYDSQRPINRTAGRDRLFQLDPLDRVYPLFGDSSTRFEAAQSNSKLYARIDHKRSYAMFGDFEADMDNLTLAGYSRKLTGVKLHLENSNGDSVTLTGARPDTSFARDIFPAGGLGLLQLSHGQILPGSETVVLEIRDRRNPEIILSRETLARSIDYNLDPVSGQLFFLRYLSTFDFNFNLGQLVVTYEHRADSLSSAVYTVRARKNFSRLGLQLGFGGVLQRQQDTGSFLLGGIDGEKRLPGKGILRFAFARSQGEMIDSGNSLAAGNNEHNGDAYQVELNQPIPFKEGVIRARYSFASAGFFNPFGATVTPGSARAEVGLDLKPRAGSTLHFGFMDERNRTATVENHRVTFSAAWDQTFKERVRLHLGYDHRSFDDQLSARTTESNLITAGADVKVTDKLQLAVKREQNLGEADPSYPNQTTLTATYQVSQRAKVFLTQRLASAAITPIADFSNSIAGFASTGSKHETAVGIETRLGKYTSATGRYQLENGANGSDTFAVIGLQNRLPINKQLSLELGFEHGFHLAGVGPSFNGATVGFGWQPNDEFRAFGRYEFRDRAGKGQLIAVGAAGRIREGITALARFQFARAGFDGRQSLSTDGMAALAIRPLNSDRGGLLFSFNHRSMNQVAGTAGVLPALSATRDRVDTLATDGYYQATKNLELYARLALRFSANGQGDLPFVSTLTYLTQERAQYRLSHRLDWATEMRLMIQPSSGTHRTVVGTELGFWVLPDLRVGGGYNFTIAGEPNGSAALPTRRGFYFTISSKLSNLFDLFGTPRAGLASETSTQKGTK